MGYSELCFIHRLGLFGVGVRILNFTILVGLREKWLFLYWPFSRFFFFFFFFFVGSLSKMTIFVGLPKLSVLLRAL